MIARIRSKNLHTWLFGYGRFLARRWVAKAHPLQPRQSGPRHLLVALCDHFEPRWNGASMARAVARVRAWQDEYPRLTRRFCDADGKGPQHSFFFPGEEYAPQLLDMLAELAKRGHGEVEFHLHHHGDTPASLRESICGHVRRIAEHGHFSRDRDGRPRYAFIHGNWSLANGRPDGRWCGVDSELPILWETGCYVDMTFPCAPDPCQPGIVNAIYWPAGNVVDLARRRAYERGEPAVVGACHGDRILLIQGPLAPALRPGKLAIRIDSAAIDATDPPSAARLHTWVSQGIHVAGRPEWVFVKLHTHGAPEHNARVLLGRGGRILHQVLTGRYNDGEHWVLHYVTAREMYNIAMAAMDGKSGDPGQFRDYKMPPPPILRR